MNESLSSLQSSLQVTSAQLASLQNRLDSVNSNITSMNMNRNVNNKPEKKPGLASKIVKVITSPFRLIGKIKKQIRDIRSFIFIKRSGQFYNEWYLGNNPDVAKKFRSSFWHKLDETKIPLISQFGKYMAHPLRHYIKHGCYENRKPTANFDGNKYCQEYSDVDVNFINPFYHYLKFGIAEGRTHSLEQFMKDSKVLLYKSLGIRSYFLQPEDKVKTDFTSKKIAVHLHLYYVDLADEMIAYLKNIPANFDLYISVIDQDCNTIAKRFKGGIPLLDSVKVKNVPNRGRDLAPFLLTFGKELLKYDYCCHIHSKKSLHSNILKGWRKYLLSNLLGSSEQVTGILNLLMRDGKFVFPQSYQYTSDITNWGGNFQIACDFFAGKGLSIEKYQIVEFPQGTMFWCRSNCLKRLMELNLQLTDFPEEPIETDGTLAHVLERAFLILADDIEGFAYSLCNYDNPEQSDYNKNK